MRETNILITGIGGQGIISASRLLAQAAQSTGEKVIVGEAFGASQREGSVMSNVRIGQTVYGPLIAPGKADYLIAFEPYEALRCLNYLSCDGVVITNTQVSIPVRDQMSGTYPPLKEVWQILKEKGKALFCLQATQVAAGVAAKYQSHYDVTNVVILGAATAIDDFPVDETLLKATLKARFKPSSFSMNLEALKAGRALMQEEGLEKKEEL